MCISRAALCGVRPRQSASFLLEILALPNILRMLVSSIALAALVSSSFALPTDLDTQGRDGWCTFGKHGACMWYDIVNGRWCYVYLPGVGFAFPPLPFPLSSADYTSSHSVAAPPNGVYFREKHITCLKSWRSGTTAH